MPRIRATGDQAQSKVDTDLVLASLEPLHRSRAFESFARLFQTISGQSTALSRPMVHADTLQITHNVVVGLPIDPEDVRKS